MSTTQRQHATLADPRWPLLAARSPEADGAFVYAVVTTGVYCRPTCPSRLARPENIRFYDTAREAASAGFRPCRRCRPDGTGRAEERAATVEALCRIIETAERQPTLAELAERAGWSPHHLHRTFKAVTGLTPRAYGAAHRAGRVQQALVRNGSVTEAMYEAGYSSSGRFYAESDGILGMTPGRYRAGGRGVEIRFAVGACSLGAILVARTERGICVVSLGDDPDRLVRDLQDRFPAATLVGGDAAFEQEVAQVVGLVEAPGVGLELPLDIRGTAFQRRVWAALQEIPPGETRSYRQIAEHIGSPGSARAVAGACAANPLAVAIPCHRVVRNDGGLSGYRWGVERKRALLDREAAE
ncbi:bifunctional DNA-binding transcriptional regulator/O6-methylguanine-DNA methyltransferase Ada [Aquisalimonas lutea]|uniref:bifunctional DNA-binding transcriptional regulator/O6-methylguanine-DNA methyltransferase Ada n=1 Tax=Aquisalimonas lutea TaxID=1327750 RepID=UPI0025B5F239|nr:bifunctional DNA-binding transcriptional regulator/O6-methylguanine-DNA methyltransferase Ada [Aquisalimonas lutea]MDN3519421.1 bifunctional DNA-binding transcriptional regulator/O6-methylguanine-DNA methyltransferase Ada [Aquisalimonas lutea]